MPLNAPEDAIRRADQLNDDAVALAAQGDLRGALDALNQAVRIAPMYARSFLVRADVFESLGMSAPAAADKRRAEDLGHEGGDSPSVSGEGPPAVSPEDGAKVDFRHRLEELWRRRPRVPVLMTLTILGVAAAGVGIVVGLVTLLGDGGDGGSTGTLIETETPSSTTVTPTVEATPSPVPSPVDAGEGVPFTLADVQGAWETEEITIDVGNASSGFDGFQVTPRDVTAMQDAISVDVSVLVYARTEDVGVDWELVAGQAPEPKPGHSLPTYTSIWWNQNVVVVVRSGFGGVASDLLSSLLDLEP